MKTQLPGSDGENSGREGKKRMISRKGTGLNYNGTDPTIRGS